MKVRKPVIVSGFAMSWREKTRHPISAGRDFGEEKEFAQATVAPGPEAI